MSKRIFSDQERIDRAAKGKRKYYLANKAEVDKAANERRVRQRRINRLLILEWKACHPCPCGESHPAALSFHHRDPRLKDGAVYKLAKSPVSSKRLQLEIDKCDILCENCHRKFHSKSWKKDALPIAVPKYSEGKKAYHNAKRQNCRIAARRYVQEYKTRHSCKCGEKDPACLDFHHLYGKDAQISFMAKNALSISAIQAEIDKCVIVCANCHQKDHYNEDRNLLQSYASTYGRLRKGS